ncbi:MAG: hypothetical protein IJY25_03295 [Bacilli bacterium]|nr:hypothetical protein [Bacilli bacterium]
MKTALFFKKCLNKSDYFNRYNNLKSYGQILEYKIVQTIVMTPKEYNDLTSNFLIKNKYIIKYLNQLIMDSNDCVFCLFFTTNNRDGFLVYPSGYNYCRYIAYINN